MCTFKRPGEREGKDGCVNLALAGCLRPLQRGRPCSGAARPQQCSRPPARPPPLVIAYHDSGSLLGALRRCRAWPAQEPHIVASGSCDERVGSLRGGQAAVVTPSFPSSSQHGTLLGQAAAQRSRQQHKHSMAQSVAQRGPPGALSRAWQEATRSWGAEVRPRRGKHSGCGAGRQNGSPSNTAPVPACLACSQRAWRVPAPASQRWPCPGARANPRSAAR